MTRYQYKSAIIQIPIKVVTYDTSKLMELVDSKANIMAEEGWRLINFSLSPHNANFYLLVFERPAVDPDR
jgi:hypothetical protein